MVILMSCQCTLGLIYIIENLYETSIIYIFIYMLALSIIGVRISCFYGTISLYVYNIYAVRKYVNELMPKKCNSYL